LNTFGAIADEMPCLEHGVSVGRREHGRSEDRVSQQEASAFVTGRLAGPRRDRVSPEGRLAGGLCEPGRRLTAVRTVKCAPERAQWLAVGNREPVALSWKRAELGPGGLARAGDRGRPRPWLGSYVSDHRSSGAGGARPAPAGRAIRRYPGLKRLQVGQPGALSFEGADPEVWPLYSRGHTQAR
jgi:hypothetical protein